MENYAYIMGINVGTVDVTQILDVKYFVICPSNL